MSTVEELKKYKELLDNSIITQEEFDKKKSELLAKGLSDSGETERKKIKKHVLKNWLHKPYIKKILIAVLAIATIICVARIVIHYQEVARASARTSALEEAIEPIMDKYGLNPYSVRAPFLDDKHYFPIYADGFESLTYGEALECLEELENISIDDPCGTGEQLDFDEARVHPGQDVWYYYWRVTSDEAFVDRAIAEYSDAPTFNLTTLPGLYCNQYDDECIYVCDN